MGLIGLLQVQGAVIPGQEQGRALDSLGGGNLLRRLDSLGGSNLLRDLESLGGAQLLRSFDSLGQGHILRQLDTLGGANLPYYRIPKKKLVDILSGLAYSLEKPCAEGEKEAGFPGKKAYERVGGFDRNY